MAELTDAFQTNSPEAALLVICPAGAPPGKDYRRYVMPKQDHGSAVTWYRATRDVREQSILEDDRICMYGQRGSLIRTVRAKDLDSIRDALQEDAQPAGVTPSWVEGGAT